VTFAGSPDRAEGRLVHDAGYELEPFAVTGLPRRPGLELVRALGRAVTAPFRARRILRARRPGVVLGGGGSVGGPMVLAAWTLRIPAVTTEADARLGLGNRLASPFARRVFLAYPIEGRRGGRYRVVGRPIPARSRAPRSREAARAELDLPADGPLVLVVGGSQGARALNLAALDAFATRGPAVLHLCGERDHAQLAPRVTRPDYCLVPFTDRFGVALAASDLVVSRAGGAVWEIAAAGRPALLVPYPHATGDHQTRTARHFAAGGGAVLVPEAELDLRREVEALLADPGRLERMGEAMRALARPYAAEHVAEELIALAAARG
jgi:UDP-N-acetylglucosamine--N-acetylmuramyl-(pentapeptide) pyrophosphoryl-undecaprenol N-acetylglucosamine transferase